MKKTKDKEKEIQKNKRVVVKFPKNFLKKIKNKQKSIIYDCFTFFNELDLLEIRFGELDKVVDYFVLAEANSTFSGKPKEFLFEKNKERYKKYFDKIIYVKIIKMPRINIIDKFFIELEKKLPRRFQLILRRVLARIIGGVARYKMIEYQRRMLIEGLAYASDEDIIMGTDVDEIPKSEKIEEMKKMLEKYRYVEFELANFRYYLNGKVYGKGENSPGTRACKIKTLRKELKNKIDFLRTTPYLWRKINPRVYGKKNYYTIKKGGWHFSYLGGVKKVIEKYKNVSHPEFDRPELKNEKFVKEIIEKGIIPLENSKIRYIKIDETFPKIIKKNLKKYSKYIKR